MNWRHLNNVLHRDIGYLAVGLSLVYGVSGLAVNHKADWNPSYAVTKTVQKIEPVAATERSEIVREVLGKLSILETPRNTFRPNPATLQVFLKERNISVDLPTGTVISEHAQARPVLYEMNQMHLNTPKRLWTIVADAYAVALIVLAITGLFVLKGRLGITGRGAWLTAVGIALPVAYWMGHLYFG